MSAAAQNLLLTGRPGIGKTTVITRLAARMTDRRIAGFYTEEIRAGGRRQGFRAATFSGRTTVLAHVEIPGRQRVGRYGVDVAALEQLVLPELGRSCEIMLIDEIGKMECFSSPFVAAVGELLDGPTPVVATVAISGGGFIAEVKARPDVENWSVTQANRDELPRELAEHLQVGRVPPSRIFSTV
ncbi:MAG: nucleoside-triphosphatase [Planctomycetota bacterium]|jgi:nucleoside-triphosphatase